MRGDYPRVVVECLLQPVGSYETGDSSGERPAARSRLLDGRPWSGGRGTMPDRAHASRLGLESPDALELRRARGHCAGHSQPRLRVVEFAETGFRACPCHRSGWFAREVIVRLVRERGRRSVTHA